LPTLDIPDYIGTSKEVKIPMHYEIYGKGKPIVLIHGWLCHGHFWDDFLYLADQGFQLIIPDLRGHGQTPEAHDVSIKIFAEDINRLLEFLKIDKAIIIGHSMGGLTTVAFHDFFPEKCMGLGLFDTGARIPFGYGIGTSGYIFRMISFVLGLYMAYPITPLFKFTLAQGWKLAFKAGGKDKTYQQFVPDVKKMTKKSVLRAAMALPGYNGVESAKRVKVPTMLLQGTKDRHITPIQTYKLLQKLIPHSKAYLVDNVAHFAPNENFSLVKEYLDEFIMENKFK